MKVVIAVLVVIIVVLVAALIAWAVKDRREAVRRDEWQRAKQEAHKAGQNLLALEITVDKIETELDNVSDIESLLAAKIRQHVREYRRGRIDQTA
ncbi:hypothetical protein [Actinophytocola sp.]|uniref:hypothetical protein n=1 Tax=Actinophytocola sp. TaxID=1872138 RepID=UPI002D809D69|nr:hypothetical protein [Actinophytocola sp.]HET9144095.1 hypothetical protein [Actinophytocola sp.]